MRIALKKDNHGSTLILVVVAISFISILGMLILSLTMTNIQIKQSDLMAKGNFYQSEEVIDEFRAVLANTSSDAIQEAYEYVLANYSKYTSMSGTSLKEEFDKRYINNLFKKIAPDFETFNPNDFSGTVERKQYNFSTSKLNGLMKTDKYKHAIINEQVLAEDLTKSIIEICYKKDAKDNKLVLKGLRIKYTDSKTDYESTIQTDLNLLIPDMDFDSTKLMPSFKNYALVADKGLTVTNSGTDPSIYGNIYTGADEFVLGDESKQTGGINLNSLANLTIKPLGGEKEVTIVNRMDMNVENGCTLLIGEDGKQANLWTRNIRTKRGATSEGQANITVFGNLYVEDDTRLDAINSNVAYKGDYTGFSYNKTNTVEEEGKLVTDSRYNSNYSSAIYINGRSSHLNLRNMNSIHLAGRTFIARSKAAIDKGAERNDIPMGESITVKSNQIAYLIPSDYMMTGGKKMSNPVAVKAGDALPTVTFSIPEEISSLGLNNPVYTVNIHQSGTTMLAYYYYNFKSQKAANDYFETYYNKYKSNLDSSASNYLATNIDGVDGTVDGIELGGDSIITGGYALKFETENVGDVVYSNSSIFAEPVFMNHSLGAFLNVAKEYKALQDTLRNDIAGITNHRYGEETDVADDKTKNPLIKNILAQTGSQSTIEIEAMNDVRDASGKNKYGFKREANYDYKFVPISLQDGSDGYIYIVKNTARINLSTVNHMNNKSPIGFDKKSGIIVCTGDVNVDCNFDGVIIAGGKVQIAQSGITLKANPRLAQEIINCAFVAEKESEGTGNEKTKISHYFDAYSTEIEGSNVKIEDVNVMDYITFSNWKKNVE